MAGQYGLLADTIGSISIGDSLVPLILIAITAVAITRDTRGLKLIVFPIALGYSRLGLNINLIILALAGVLWGVTLLSTHALGSTLMGIGTRIRETVTGTEDRAVQDEWKSMGRSARISNKLAALKNQAFDPIVAPKIPGAMDIVDRLEREKRNKDRLQAEKINLEFIRQRLRAQQKDR